MKKFNKASLVIAPMALMLFSSSLNIPKIMADDNNNMSWSEKDQIKQREKEIEYFKSNYNDKLIEKISYEGEAQLSDFLGNMVNYLNRNFSDEILNSAIQDFNDQQNYYNNFDSSNVDEQNIKNLINKVNDNINSYNLNERFKKVINTRIDLNTLKNYVYTKEKNTSLITNELDNIKKLSIKYYDDSKVKINNMFNKFKDLSIKYNDFQEQSTNRAKQLKRKYEKITDNKNISQDVINDLNNTSSDFNYVNDTDFISDSNDELKQKYTEFIQRENSLSNLSSYGNKFMNQSEEYKHEETNKNSGEDFFSEVDNLKQEIEYLKNSNGKGSQTNYVPINNTSNNSSINNDKDIKNELNNAKNNINNIINKNVELSNTTSSLKNEIETLKQQVHELKNNKKSKHKNTKANKRALNKKKKELNKVNKELKKHIRKSNKKKLIQKRNSILKSIKKLNK